MSMQKPSTADRTMAGAAIIARNRRSQIEEEASLLALEARYCAHGDSVHYAEPPKIFDHCEGSYLYDIEGRQFLDLQMWHSAVNFGYANRRLNGALQRQLNRLPQIASHYLHREKIELAAWLARRAEASWGEKGRVHFNVGGSRALEDALKLVRNASGGKGLLFSFEGADHGRMLRRAHGDFDGAHVMPFPHHKRGMSKEEHGAHCLQQFERLLETGCQGAQDDKTRMAEYAAFLIEPIQGAGYVIPPRNFFRELKKILDRHGILLVVDEIEMGVYRTGKLWSIEHFGVTPDILVFGKAITNGLNPLSGIWAREELISPEVFPPGSTSSAFASNPLGTAVALETVRMLDEEDFGEGVMLKGAYFLKGLEELKRRYAIVGDVDGLGLALRMEICAEDGYTPDKAMVERMVGEGLKGDLEAEGKHHGLVLDVGGHDRNVITLAPALTISYDEIGLALKLLDRLLHRVTRR
jgi:4-aminobutyrate aminotransferase / (S)-3-amino-2-methylpropionate transaminase / 5-aminovalerate transaminase